MGMGVGMMRGRGGHAAGSGRGGLGGSDGRGWLGLVEKGGDGGGVLNLE